MSLIIAASVFLTFSALSLSIYFLMIDRQARKGRQVLRSLALRRAPERETESILKQTKNRGHFEKLLGRLMDVSVLQTLIIAADMKWSVEMFLLLSLGIGFLMQLPVLVLLHHPAALFFFIPGAFVPLGFLLYRCKKREEALAHQMPDVLGTIVRALKAGQPLDSALREVGANFSAPIGHEIRLIYEEIALGMPFAEALRNFQGRFPRMSDVRMVCTALIIQRETGGNLTRILENLSATIRERFQLSRQVKVLTAEGKGSAMILGLLPLVLSGLFWLLNPDYISVLFVHPVGRKLLILAVLFEITGFMVMRWMTRLEI